MQLLIDLPVLTDYEIDVLARLEQVRGDPERIGLLDWNEVLPRDHTPKHLTWLNRLTLLGLIVQHPGGSSPAQFSISFVGEQLLASLRSRRGETGQ